MLRIPYVPKAYPDELLASLLTRLMLYNGPGLWRSLLEDCGYGRRTISPFFSPPIQDANLDKLLAVLGYTYPQMLRELTVLPFWLSFNQATRVQSRIRLDASTERATKLHTLGHSQRLPGARYCPACLLDDIKVHGEPYLHRHHQLPVATLCALHGVALRSACPACGITVMPFNRALLRPPALKCQCGQDLSRVTETPPEHQQALLRLSRFAADTLSCTDAPWTLEQVMVVLRERSIMMRGSFKRGATRLMQDAYGEPHTGPFVASTIQRWGDTGSLRLKTGGGASELRAPEFCALLAATGLSFDEFKQAVRQVEVATTPSKSTPRRPFNIDQARHEFRRFEAASPGQGSDQLRKSALKLFWLLRLRDSALLQAHGYRHLRPAPTIEADRKKLEELLRLGSRIRTTRLPAYIRASIRDQAWLQAFKEAQRFAHVTSQTRAQRAQQDRVVALSRAVFSVLRTQGRPARVHAGLLAKSVGITMALAQYTIARTPALQGLVAAVNAGKDRRLAFWAARGFIEEGRYPSANEVLVRAGLPAKRVNRQFCIEAIACFSTRYSSR